MLLCSFQLVRATVATAAAATAGAAAVTTGAAAATAGAAAATAGAGAAAGVVVGVVAAAAAGVVLVVAAALAAADAFGSIYNKLRRCGISTACSRAALARNWETSLSACRWHQLISWRTLARFRLCVGCIGGL